MNKAVNKISWQTKKLGDICDFYSGLWKGKKLPYIKVGVIRNTNFTKDGRLDESDIAYLNVEKRQFEKRKLKFGDIILEKSGGGPKQPVGRVIIFDKKDGDFSFSNFTAVIRIKNPSELDFNFLHKFLFFSYISGITESMQSHSTGIRNLDSKLYKEIRIPLPPLPEQNRIVKILDEVFKKTAKAKENTEKNLRNAKDLFESYLKSIFANPDEDWETVDFDDSIDKIINTTKIQRSKFLESGKYPVISQEKNLINGYWDREKDLFIIKRPVVIFGDHTQILKYIDFNFVLGADGVKILQPKEFILPKFFYYFLKSVSLKSLGYARHYRHLKERQVCYPKSLSKQKSIVTKLDVLSDEIKKLDEIYNKKLFDLEELKKSVLKSAFAGKL